MRIRKEGKPKKNKKARESEGESKKTKRPNQEEMKGDSFWLESEYELPAVQSRSLLTIRSSREGEASERKKIKQPKQFIDVSKGMK
jgi:hypothetical protein